MSACLICYIFKGPMRIDPTPETIAKAVVAVRNAQKADDSETLAVVNPETWYKMIDTACACDEVLSLFGIK